MFITWLIKKHWLATLGILYMITWCTLGYFFFNIPADSLLGKLVGVWFGFIIGVAIIGLAFVIIYVAFVVSDLRKEYKKDMEKH